MESERPRILLAASGSVAAIKFGVLCHSFSEWAEIKAVVTKSSLHFVDNTSLPSSLVLYTDEDEWSSWKSIGDSVLHIELRKWADAMVIAPLSANTLAKMAGGLCDNLLTCVVRAWDFRKPLFVAPAMNTFMWNSYFTKKHLDFIGELGVSVIPPVAKTLACGDYGNGAMAEPAIIDSTVRSQFGNAYKMERNLQQNLLQIDKGGNLFWNDRQVDYLFECMLEQACIPGMKSSGGLKTKAMRVVEKKLMDKFGPNFTLDKITNKLKRVKPNLQVCKDILSHPGISWDKERKCILVDDDVWEEYIQRYPDRKRYRNVDKWRYYEQCMEIYDQSAPTGLHRNSVLHLTNNDHEMQPETLPEDISDHDNGDSYTSDDAPSFNQAPESSCLMRPSGKKQRCASSDATSNDSLNRFCMHIERMSKSSSYNLINSCAKVLKEMQENGEIDTGLRMNALNLVEDTKRATVFLALEPDLRIEWLKDKLPHLF